MLKDLSADKTMMPSSEIMDIASGEGISKRTLESAKKELGIRAKRVNNIWYWDLKQDDTNEI